MMQKRLVVLAQLTEFNTSFIAVISVFPICCNVRNTLNNMSVKRRVDEFFSKMEEQKNCPCGLDFEDCLITQLLVWMFDIHFILFIYVCIFILFKFSFYFLIYLIFPSSWYHFYFFIYTSICFYTYFSPYYILLPWNYSIIMTPLLH